MAAVGWISPQATDEQFRVSGFTANARQFPLSEAAARWIASFNGIPFEQIPSAWCYAPNEYMLNEVERLAQKGASPP